MTVPGVLLIIGVVFTLAVELYGAFVRRAKGDTISEGVWWVRDRLPKPAWYVLLTGLAGTFGWVVWHFGWQG